MASRYPRLQVPRDPELDWAIARARALLGPDTPSSQVIHDLAVRGAAALELPDALVAAAAAERGFGVLHYDQHFDRLATVLGFTSRWVATAGSISWLRHPSGLLGISGSRGCARTPHAEATGSRGRRSVLRKRNRTRPVGSFPLAFRRRSQTAPNPTVRRGRYPSKNKHEDLRVGLSELASRAGCCGAIMPGLAR